MSPQATAAREKARSTAKGTFGKQPPPTAPDARGSAGGEHRLTFQASDGGVSGLTYENGEWACSAGDRLTATINSTAAGGGQSDDAAVRLQVAADFLNWGWIPPDPATVAQVEGAAGLLQGPTADIENVLTDDDGELIEMSMDQWLAAFSAAARQKNGARSMLGRSAIGGFWEAETPLFGFDPPFTEEFWLKVEESTRTVAVDSCEQLDRCPTLRKLVEGDTDRLDEEWEEAVYEGIWAQIRGQAAGGGELDYSTGRIVGAAEAKAASFAGAGTA